MSGARGTLDYKPVIRRHLTGRPLLSCVLVLTVGAAFIAAVMVSVWASDVFSDVLTGIWYHDAVSWVKQRGITAGCGGGNYCPDNAVTRAQMAVFLQKEGEVLSPTFLLKNGAASGQDFAVNPIVCATTTDYTPAFSQVARIDAHMSFRNDAPAAATAWFNTAYSTNAGASWFIPFPSADILLDPKDTTWTNVSTTGIVSLSPGLRYRFSGYVYPAIGAPQIQLLVIGAGQQLKSRIGIHESNVLGLSMPADHMVRFTGRSSG